MNSMEHDKETNYINVTLKYPNGTEIEDEEGNVKVDYARMTIV